MTLSRREKEFASLLLAGLKYDEIAEFMGIGVRAVKGFMHNITLKLNTPPDRLPRIWVAVKIHEMRKELGVQCPSCDEV